MVEDVEHASATLRITARARATVGVCPRCGTGSARVHGRYERTVRDTAVGGAEVVIRLRIRRFLCPEFACPAMTFAEQVPGLTCPHGRFSLPRKEAMTAIARALAGRAGARLARLLGMPVNRMTLLRSLRALPGSELAAAPSVLGVDDFALKRGNVYGTVLVDMNTHRPVDLLPGRTSATFAAWLEDHPGTQVICRDRSGSYADGARIGAPDALQVADRFHLWHNLTEVVDKTVRAHRACLDEAPLPSAETEAAEPPDTPRPEARDANGRERRLVTRTIERHAAVHALLAEGASLNAISRQLGLVFRTVRRFAHAATPDELLIGALHRPTKLDDYKPYLARRWNEGCHNAAQLHEEIKAQGWTGCVRSVQRYMEAFRGQETVTPAPAPPPKPRHVTGWIMSHPQGLDPDDAVRLKAVLDQCPELDALARHVRNFAQMMVHREGHRLDGWITAASTERLPALGSFARSLSHDHAAVRAGLSLPHSSGAVEGTVNKIKMLKRQMFGRANFDLLRIRVLYPI
ncbi:MULTISPECIES: ISL3 family transposase [unclassified Nocardiopsis]|uniref:ISL3 family transposase n=1 Tax=unclassified Nocardiopsis TaxID=2649073 RepID=UPI0030828334